MVFAVAECHEWSAAPISSCLRRAATRLFSQGMLHWWRVNGSTALELFPCTTHERRIRGWTGRKNRFQVWVRPRQESNPNPAYQLCWRVHKQLCQQFTRCAERAPAQIAVFVISICEKAMLVYVVSLFLTKIGSIIWSNQLRGPVCDINEYFY